MGKGIIRGSLSVEKRKKDEDTERGRGDRKE